jgi:hypothetical protein
MEQETDKPEKRKWVEGAFQAIQMMTDPQGYARDEIRNAYAEIRQYTKFYLLHALNEKAEESQGLTDNIFTDEERKQWFGNGKLTLKDLKWERIEALLRPAPVEGAVSRWNGAVDGSHINQKFSAVIGSKAIYTPRTVTKYDSKEHAMAAAKFLRLMTEGSGAVIIAEPLIHIGQKDTWVVSDNMNLKTHNALRLFMSAMAQEQSKNQLEKATQQVQEEVNKRLPKGEQWEAWDGVGTLLTLQGRPGVKMYKKLPNGKDDPDDVKALSVLHDQRRPTVIMGVPERFMAQDGRSLFDPDNLYAVIGHRVLGPKGYALVTTGSTRVLGQLVKDELHGEYGKLWQGKSAGDISGNVAVAGAGLLAYPLEIALKAGSATAGSLATLGLITAGTGAHKLACAGVGVARGMRTSNEYRPPRSLVGSVLKRQAQKAAGYSFGASKLTKDWERRDFPDALLTRTDDVQAQLQQAVEGDAIVTPLGTLPADDVLTREWVQRISMEEKAKAFAQYMRDNKLYPSLEVISDNGMYPFPEKELPQHTEQAIDVLAEQFAKWVLKATRLRADMNKVLSDEDSQLSRDLTEAMNGFERDLNSIHKLPGNTSNRMKQLLRDALNEGMKGFLLTELSKPVSAVVAA